VGSARHKRCSSPISARQEQWLDAYKPPQRKLQRWRLAHHSTLASETVTTKPFFRELFTPNGGLVVSVAAAKLASYRLRRRRELVQNSF
jgi:hypothetical protein